jgi:hypothetical protein
MKITIIQVINHETQERKTCGEVVFCKSNEQENILFVENTKVKVANSEIYFSASFDTSTSSISIFIKEEDEHIFTAMFNWNHITPYFAFTLTDGTFTELYFKK